MQNIDSDLIRGNIDTIILKTMLNGDMYGLDIIKEVENKSNGTYELKQPTLYSCLKRLENQELISSYWKESDIGGRRHYYKLTDKGYEQLYKKQDEWSKSKFIIDNLLGEHTADYRLVKKNDYDKIIEGKKFEYNEDEEPSKVENVPENMKVVYVPKEEEVIESDNSPLKDEPVYVDSSASEQIGTFGGDGYSEDADKYKSQENNILYNLRNADADVINEYYGDKKSYVKQIQMVNEPELEESEEIEEISNENEEINDEPDYIQQNIMDLGVNDSSDEVDETLSEFEKNIELLNNFKMKEGSETDAEIEDIGYDDDVAFSYEQPVEETIEDDSDDNDYSISYENIENEPTVFAETSKSDFLDELNELGLNGYTNEYHASEDENEANRVVTAPLTTPRFENTINYNEPKVQVEPEPIQEEPEISVSHTEPVTSPVIQEPVQQQEPYVSEPIEHIESDDELWNTWNKDDPYSYSDPVYDNYQVGQASFDEILFKNTNQQESFEPKYNSFVKTENNVPKQKLQNLGAYSKVTTNKPDSLEKAKDINTLKDEFEKEGIKVTEFKKEEVSEFDKNYLLINKLNIIKSFILLFGYVFILSALYLILGATNFKNTTGFSFICFLYGFIPFGVYAIYSTVMYLLNPYKKIPAKYAAGIMFFISAIITVQLLLITYCVNLQIGFYSFAQAGYNHLNWIVPLVVSFAPLISTGIHCALFYSRNFNV